jgi:hypothetical protein
MIFEFGLTFTKLVSMPEVGSPKFNANVFIQIFEHPIPIAELRYELRQRQTIDANFCYLTNPLKHKANLGYTTGESF